MSADAETAPDMAIDKLLPPILLLPDEAARLLRISPRLLEELRAAGDIVAVSVGFGKERRTWRYLPSDLLAWATERRYARKSSDVE